MAKKRVKVTVSLPTDPTGPISAHVDKWTVWTSAKNLDSVEWTLVPGGKGSRATRMSIKEFRIVTPGGQWPFQNANPGWKLKTIDSGFRKKLREDAYTLDYSVQVKFTDDLGDERILTIDPDMVIES